MAKLLIITTAHDVKGLKEVVDLTTEVIDYPTYAAAEKMVHILESQRLPDHLKIKVVKLYGKLSDEAWS